MCCLARLNGDRKFNRGRGSLARLGTRRHDTASEPARAAHPSARIAGRPVSLPAARRVAEPAGRDGHAR
jgi:hypothetical protein